MKGLFIPEITAEMFRNGCLESIETLMAEGEIYDIDYRQPCEDAISRQIISDYVESHIQEINTGYGDLNEHTNRILRMIVDYIEKMESVTPKPKTGRWIYDNLDWRCSECNEAPKTLGYVGTADFMSEHFKYCNHCGARMIKPQESEDKHADSN